jgi:hypothetical protein
MQQWPLQVNRILDYAARWHPEQAGAAGKGGFLLLHAESAADRSVPNLLS